jgi:hypothetical protein
MVSSGPSRTCADLARARNTRVTHGFDQSQIEATEKYPQRVHLNLMQSGHQMSDLNPALQNPSREGKCKWKGRGRAAPGHSAASAWAAGVSISKNEVNRSRNACRRLRFFWSARYSAIELGPLTIRRVISATALLSPVS